MSGTLPSHHRDGVERAVLGALGAASAGRFIIEQRSLSPVGARFQMQNVRRADGNAAPATGAALWIDDRQQFAGHVLISPDLPRLG